MSDITWQHTVAFLRQKAAEFSALADRTEAAFSDAGRASELTVDSVSALVRKKAQRVATLAMHFRAHKADVELFLQRNADRFTVGDRGWITLRENAAQADETTHPATEKARDAQ